jgi:hypothetical protein
MSIKKTQQYVYRVEDRAGFGPYRNPRFWMHSWTKSNHDSKDHPSPKEDLQDSHREFQSTCWYCGFETLKSFQSIEFGLGKSKSYLLETIKRRTKLFLILI